MANLTPTDKTELLEIDEAKASNASPSMKELMVDILTQMSANLNTVNESLKYLPQLNLTTVDATVQAKKAKTLNRKKLNRKQSFALLVSLAVYDMILDYSK